MVRLKLETFFWHLSSSRELDGLPISLPQRLLNLFAGVTVDCLGALPPLQELSMVASAVLPVPAGPGSRRLTGN